MFTGIVEELGQVIKLQRVGRNNLLELTADKVCEDAKIGDSIAVNGACLTLVKHCKHVLSFEVMPQTFQATNLINLKIKHKVNLERSLKAGDRVNGHFVYGHVDCVGVVRRKTFIQGNLCFEISIPVKFMPKIVLRGSVAVDGISLTVQNKKSSTFSVYIIPHTLKNTTLEYKGPSGRVNIELDKLNNL